MESFLKWISFIGTLASVASAIWAFIEARKAKKTACEIERYRNEIVGRRRLVEASRLYAETDRMIRSVSKNGPSCNPKVLKGFDLSPIIQEIEEYVRFVNGIKGDFEPDVREQAISLCFDLSKDVESLSSPSSYDHIKEVGKNVYVKLSNFLPVTKSVADAHIERA